MLGRTNGKSPTDFGENIDDTSLRNESADETDSADQLAASKIIGRTPQSDIETLRNPKGSMMASDEPEEIDRHRRKLDEQLHDTLHSNADATRDYSQILNGSEFRLHAGNRDFWVSCEFKGSGSSSTLLDERTTLGFDFTISLCPVEMREPSISHTARRNRSKFTLKKRQALPALLDHQEAYKSYTEVTNSAVRCCLVNVARMFTDLDKFFAAMFVHMIMASDIAELRRELQDIRHEISLRQRIESSQEDDQDIVYLGDLGHYCEGLLEHRQQAIHNPQDKSPVPEFTSTHSDERSWLDYLEDGFEIPYWKMMLDAFSTSRLNKPTLGGKMISTALISMRADILNLRCKLQKALDAMPGGESLEGIVSVVDKRIRILRSFTDRVVPNEDADIDHVLDLLSSSSTNATWKPQLTGTLGSGEDSSSMKEAAESPASDPLLLVTLVLLTLVVATVPFALGFKAINEAGSVSDADFWLNISSSIFTIMANFVMIIQLTHGSRFSKQYMSVWIWFFLGIACAITSVAIYPFCNTAWSSLLSFFATIAGFGATLSVAMTVESPRHDESPGKKKID